MTDLTPDAAPVAKPKRSRKNAHNEKRMARFTAAGLTDADIQFATATMVGEGETECALCDHGIKYLFALTFERPLTLGGPVRFDPVGSKCITDWFQAFAASPARDAVLDQVKVLERALAKERKRMTALLAVADALAGEGFEAGAAILRRFVACPAARKSEVASDIALKVMRSGGFVSDKQGSYFESLVTRAERGERPTPPNGNVRPPVTSTPVPPPVAPGSVCPACDGPMRERNGARGPFLGCCSFPVCRGTREVARREPTLAEVAAPGDLAVARALAPRRDDPEPPAPRQSVLARLAAQRAAAGGAEVPPVAPTRPSTLRRVSAETEVPTEVLSGPEEGAPF